MMNQNYDEKFWEDKKCPPIQCKKDLCKCGLAYVSIPVSLGNDSEGSDVAPKKGAYCNAIVKYEENGAVYIYSKEGIPVLIKEGVNNG